MFGCSAQREFLECCRIRFHDAFGCALIFWLKASVYGVYSVSRVEWKCANNLVSHWCDFCLNGCKSINILSGIICAYSRGNELKILELLECSAHQPEAARIVSGCATKNDETETAGMIAHPALRELDNLIRSAGFHLCNFIAADEIAVIHCLVNFAKQTTEYRPSAMVERIANHLHSKVELARAIA